MQALQLPPLDEGEIYVGAIGDQKGEAYHLILLPGDSERAEWQAQMDWAKSIGGDLPNRIESAMLFAHSTDQFQKAWYWTNETLAIEDEPDNTSWAWSQTFSYGDQYYDPKLREFRARAVRRLPI